MRTPTFNGTPAILVAAVSLLGGIAVAAPGDTTVVSAPAFPNRGNNISRDPSISADGRYVAFWSQATNLVAGDSNGRYDVFVHDRQTSVTTRVSVDSVGTQGNSDSYKPSISADGRYVAFYSNASNLVAGDTSGRSDVFVHDRDTGATTRVSVDSSATQGNSDSQYPSISADGRYVAFWSTASNLVAGDSNGNPDVFVHDRQTGSTTRVSVDSSGTQGNSDSQSASISGDGRYVAFWSNATNLVPGDGNGTYDVFVHDRQTGSTTRVSVDSSGTQGNSASSFPSISADGRYVAFYSYATNLVAGDSNGTHDVFVRDRQTGSTTRVSVDSSATQGNSSSYYPSISGDGRYVAFYSNASNLVAGDTNGRSDVFVHDRDTGAMTRVSVDSSATQGNSDSQYPSISADGRYVAFWSTASNLVAGDSNGTYDVFVRDTVNQSTNIASVGGPTATANGDSAIFGADAKVSADGRYVAFYSYATNLVAGDSNGTYDVFVRDRQTGSTTRVSVDSSATQGNSSSIHPSISGDGRYVAFFSYATNLVAGDTNSRSDVFVHDRQTGSTTRVSVDSIGTQGNSDSYFPSISGDGRYVAFWSQASNLVAGDTNGRPDVFVHDRQTGSTTRVSVDSIGTQGNSDSQYPSISADGRYVAFWSQASNLVAGDSNGNVDVFVHDRQTSVTTRVSVGPSGAQGNNTSYYPSISGDGRYVAFWSVASNLVAGDSNGTYDVFVHDRQTSVTTRVSVDSIGTQGNGVSQYPSISADGRYVAFYSYATNLVVGDTNGRYDVFVRDRQIGSTTRVSVDSSGTQGNSDSYYPSISADGRYVAFVSTATNLVAGDGNGTNDVFVHELDVLPADTTPPTITANVSGTLGGGGWYVSDVDVSWTVDDPDSDVTAQSGCGATSVTADSAGDTFTCSATSGGGTASDSVTIQRDATPPVVTLTPLNAPNGNGWYNVAAGFDVSGVDAAPGSGLASCDGPLSINTQGENLTATGICTDVAGNEGTASETGIDIDWTPPATTASKSPPANAAGWNNSDVAVTFTATDAVSGVDACTGGSTLTAEGAGQVVNGACSDLAGNSSGASTTVSIDKTAPSATASRAPAANTYGWNNTDVTVSYTGTDALSTIDTCSPAEVFSAEGAGQSSSGSCSDQAGNSASAGVTDINIDKTAPVVSVTTPSDGASYLLNDSVLAAYTCTDGLAGIASCTAPVANGNPVDTSTAGSLTATGTDRAGNSASDTNSYTVRYGFVGFLQPIDNLPVYNAVNAGRTIPVKWQLVDANGAYLSSLTTFKSLGSLAVACESGAALDDIEETVATGGTVLRYDATSNQFVYNWATTSSWKGKCRKLVLELQDGQKKEALFRFK